MIYDCIYWRYTTLGISRRLRLLSWIMDDTTSSKDDFVGRKIETISHESNDH